MKIYEYQITVSKDDIDALNHVNNVRYVDWINEAAKKHWHLTAPKKIRDLFYWVVVSHHIDYKSPAFLNDVILIKTYVRTSEGVKSFRVVEIHNLNSGKLSVKSETVWCMVDSKTHRPHRIPEEVITLYT